MTIAPKLKKGRRADNFNSFINLLLLKFLLYLNMKLLFLLCFVYIFLRVLCLVWSWSWLIFLCTLCANCYGYVLESTLLECAYYLHMFYLLIFLLCLSQLDYSWICVYKCFCVICWVVFKLYAPSSESLVSISLVHVLVAKDSRKSKEIIMELIDVLLQLQEKGKFL